MIGLETRESSHLHLNGIDTWQELTEEKQFSAPHVPLKMAFTNQEGFRP